MGTALGIAAIGTGVLTLFIILSCCVAASDADDDMEQLMKDYKGEQKAPTQSEN